LKNSSVGTDVASSTATAAGTLSFASNVFIGYQVARSATGITSASNNIFLGHMAGQNITSGTSNILLGRQTSLLAGTNNLAIVIGDSAAGLGSNRTVLQLTSVRGSGVATQPLQIDNITGQVTRFISSRRYKKDIQDITLEKSSLVLTGLRPRSFSEKDTRKRIHGFIAEEVFSILPEITFQNKQGQVEGYNIKAMVSLLVKEVQHLRQLIKTKAKK
jgi:hypothetical protein